MAPASLTYHPIISDSGTSLSDLPLVLKTPDSSSSTYLSAKRYPQEEDRECFGVFCLTYDLKALASGEVFGQDQTIALKLLGSERSFEALEGVGMELYPLLKEVRIGIDPYEVFQDVQWALLIGAKPRGPGMESAGLLDINGQIFAAQGKALNAVASRNVKVMVVGNPCNTKMLLIYCRRIFHALTRLDENRAKCQLALKAGVFYDKVSNVTIWGNHSTTQVIFVWLYMTAKTVQPHHGIPVKEVIQVQQVGALIKKWGRSSAASTAVSIVDGIRSLVSCNTHSRG